MLLLLVNFVWLPFSCWNKADIQPVYQVMRAKSRWIDRRHAGKPLTSTHSSWLRSFSKNCVWTISVRLHQSIISSPCYCCCWCCWWWCCCTVLHYRRAPSVVYLPRSYVGLTQIVRHLEHSCKYKKKLQTPHMLTPKTFCYIPLSPSHT